MLSTVTDTPTPPIRPLSPQQRVHRAMWTCLFRLMLHSEDSQVPSYPIIIGTPSLAGLTVAPGIMLPWPHPDYRLYGEYLATMGFEPRPPRRYPQAYDSIYLWYEPHLFLWNSFLHLGWQSPEPWSVYTDSNSSVTHICFRLHGDHHHGVWTPKADDPVWASHNTSRRIFDFWSDASPIFDSLSGIDSIPVGEWIATWGPRASAIFQPRRNLSPIRRIMMLTTMLLTTGLVTLEYRDHNYAETELARQYAITKEAQKWR